MIITNWEQVPEFAGEKEEAVFWETAQVDVRLMENSMMVNLKVKEYVHGLMEKNMLGN